MTLGPGEAILERVVREGLSEEVTFKWISEGKSTPGRGNSQHQGPHLSREERGVPCGWVEGVKGNPGGPGYCSALQATL